MDNVNIDNFTKTVTKSIGEDVYVAAKKWFSTLDPTGEKFAEYREGIGQSLGHIQIMGMASPKKLSQLYIALRTLPILRKAQHVDVTKIYSPRDEKKNLISQKYQTITSQKHVDQIISEIGYDDILVDENTWERRQLSLAKKVTKKENKSVLKNDTTMHGLSALSIIVKNDNVIILGQPGSGKTTFLKYAALAFSGFVPAQVGMKPLLPIFVPLRELKRIREPKPEAEWILDFVVNCASETGGTKYQAPWLSNHLENKKCIVLLDGIDEVDPNLIAIVMQSINAFSKKYRGNKIVATCRTAVFDYQTEGFTVGEIDDFNDSDIFIFVNQWFGSDTVKRNDLLEHIKGSKASIDLCKTPLLLTMICILYEYNQTIPSNRYELYKTCVDALLFRWDSFRYIARPSFSKGLSTSRKKMILARIARTTFDNDVYFFREESLLNMLQLELERSNLTQIDPFSLLKELESHNGLFIERASQIFCFSHMTFHEFFTALAYHEDHAQDVLLDLALTQPRYREVFLMALERSYNPDELCLKVATYIKCNIINMNETSDYYVDLISKILISDISLNPKIRMVLDAVRGDLFISDIVEIENHIDSDYEIGVQDNFNF